MNVCDVSVHSCMCLALIVHWLLQPMILELEVYGISGKFLTFIQSYLRDRYQKVLIDKIYAYESIFIDGRKLQMGFLRVRSCVHCFSYFY